MPDDPKIEEQNDGFIDDSSAKPPLNQVSKNQKWAVAGLAVFAVLIVILWSVQLKNNIYGPLNGQAPATNEQAQIDSQTANDLALKNKDTDSDGLSDYDELNIYKTSPYLADSDSDGLADGAEVKNGADPNCPVGRTCAATEPVGNSANPPTSSSDTLNNLSNQSAALNGLLNQFNATNPAAGADSGTGDLTAEQKQALEGMDAASLRQLLIEAGMDKQTLDQISDTDLMQSYSETLR
ncbi:MAG: Ig domain-containing protein [Parcubacteria group bacterium GW2011_GWC2_42_12]|nr:MAG: Ig domain-containing protein [Parcubacteria group bacterium GW2011_GWC2_42_12]